MRGHFLWYLSRNIFMVIFENRYLKKRLKNDNFFCSLQDAAILLWPLNRNYHCLKYGFFSLYNMWTNIQASFKQFPGVFRTLLTIKVSRIHLDPEMHQRVNILFYNFLKQDPPKVEQYFCKYYKHYKLFWFGFIL